MTTNHNSSHRKTADLEARLRDTRPDPPPDSLRDACLPSCDRVELQPPFNFSEYLSMHRKFVIRSAGGLTVAAAIALVVLLQPAGPAGDGRAFAAMLDQAVEALDDAEAVQITTTVDTGEGTPVSEETRVWWVPDIGCRVETPLLLNIYNVQRQQHVLVDAATQAFQQVQVIEPVRASFVLERAQVEAPLTFLRVAAALHNVQTELVTHGDQTVQRLTVEDAQNGETSVEIEPDYVRLVRAVQWKRAAPEQPRLRFQTAVEYLARTQIDPAVFDVPVPVEQNPAGTWLVARAAADVQPFATCETTTPVVPILPHYYQIQRMPNSALEVHEAPARRALFTWVLATRLQPDFVALKLGDAASDAGQIPAPAPTPAADDAEHQAHCLSNLRILPVLLQEYADQHGGALPTSIEELRPYAERTQSALSCPLAKEGETYAFEALALGLRWHNQLQPETRVFKCPNHGQHELAAFGDGHAAVDTAP